MVATDISDTMYDCASEQIQNQTCRSGRKSEARRAMPETCPLRFHSLTRLLRRTFPDPDPDPERGSLLIII